MSTSQVSNHDRDRARKRSSRRQDLPSSSSDEYSRSDSNSSNSSSDSDSDPKENIRPRHRRTHHTPRGELVSSRTTKSTRSTKSKNKHRRAPSTHDRNEKEPDNNEQHQTEFRSHNLKDDFMMSLGLAAPKSQYHRTQEEEEQHEQQRAQLRKAVQAALTAGAVEAWRTRSLEGSKKHKALRIALAAGAAGGLDVLVARNIKQQGKFAGIAESVLGGMAASSTLGGQVAHKRPGGAGVKVGDGIIAVGAGKLMERTEKRSHRMSQKLSAEIKKHDG